MGWFRPHLVVPLVLAASLSATWWLWRHEQRNETLERQANLDFNLRELASRIEQRLAAAEQVLRGVQAVLMTVGPVSREAFSAYVEAQNLGADFAGMVGVGRLELVTAAQKEAHVAAMRRTGLPNYAVRPDGERAAYAPVLQLEPAVGLNRDAPGFDPLAFPERRAALDKARDSGLVAITAKLNGRDTPLQTSFVMVLPVYRPGAPRGTVAERRAALTGWVTAPFRMNELMASLYGGPPRGLAAQVFDGVKLRPQDLMYDSVAEAAGDSASEPRVTATIGSATAIEYLQVGGRTWTLVAHPRAEPDSPVREGAWAIAFAGTAGSLLLTLLTWVLATDRARARAMAERMTQELQASEARFRHLAQVDELTQLPNRALFNDRLKLAVAHARREHGRLALLFIDLDRFKPVNDAFGHRVGDELLRAVAQRMVACVRESDTVARIGGDEFVVLLPDLHVEHDALVVAEKIRHALNQAFVLEGGQRVEISSSTGVAFYPEHGHDETALAAGADRAMYQAKQAGRDTVVVLAP